MAKKLATTIYITEKQQCLLKELNSRTKVPVAEFIRQGIDLVLQLHSQKLPGQMELSSLPEGNSMSEAIEDNDHSRIEL